MFSEELAEKSLAELRAMGRAREIPNLNKLRKGELIAILSGEEEAPKPAKRGRKPSGKNAKMMKRQPNRQSPLPRRLKAAGRIALLRFRNLQHRKRSFLSSRKQSRKCSPAVPGLPVRESLNLAKMLRNLWSCSRLRSRKRKRLRSPQGRNRTSRQIPARKNTVPAIKKKRQRQKRLPPTAVFTARKPPAIPETGMNAIRGGIGSRVRMGRGPAAIRTAVTKPLPERLRGGETARILRSARRNGSDIPL